MGSAASRPGEQQHPGARPHLPTPAPCAPCLEPVDVVEVPPLRAGSTVAFKCRLTRPETERYPLISHDTNVRTGNEARRIKLLEPRTYRSTCQVSNRGNARNVLGDCLGEEPGSTCLGSRPADAFRSHGNNELRIHWRTVPDVDGPVCGHAGAWPSRNSPTHPVHRSQRRVHASNAPIPPAIRSSWPDA